MEPSDEDVRERLAAEFASRQEVPGPIRAVVLEVPTEGSEVVPPGSILFAWAFDDSALDRVESGLDDPASLSDALVGSMDGLDLPLEEKFDILTHVPAFAAVKYRDRVLIDAATLPPALSSVGYLVLPWLGLPLDTGLFATSSWILPDAEPLSVLVVANPPLEDPTERALLSALPENTDPEMMAAMNTVTVVTKEVGKGALTWAVDKVTDKALDKVKDWNRNNERERQRDRAQAQERARLRQQAEQTRYRNAGIVASDTRVPTGETGSPAGMTIDQLVERRIAALRGSREDDDT